jgi:hypothetical protein
MPLLDQSCEVEALNLAAIVMSHELLPFGFVEKWAAG